VFDNYNAVSSVKGARTTANRNRSLSML
jgi:hypothetical protein